jgi:hypothetical protein
MDDSDLDRLLSEALAPPERPADRGFVMRVDRVLVEAERYRRWRAGLVRQLVTEALALAAVAGSLVFVSQVPAVSAALAATPGLVWPAVLALFLVWLLVRGRSGLLA